MTSIKITCCALSIFQRGFHGVQELQTELDSKSYECKKVERRLSKVCLMLLTSPNLGDNDFEADCL